MDLMDWMDSVDSVDLVVGPSPKPQAASLRNYLKTSNTVM